MKNASPGASQQRSVGAQLTRRGSANGTIDEFAHDDGIEVGVSVDLVLD